MTDIYSQIEPELTSSRPGLRMQLGGLLKRLFDIVAASWGLLFLAPFFLIIAYFLKREGPGPVFYRGPRTGRNGVPFGILKFRTMYERPESYAGPQITAADDDRVTPLGRWLRDTKLNELPQLWNVLKGEMSLVGPRPEDPSIVETWPPGARAEILSVRPGITSPASVVYRDEEKMLQSATVMDGYLREVVPAKLRLDQLYARNHTFLGDLDAISYTMVALLPGLRRTALPVENLYSGWLSHLANRIVIWLLVDFLIAFEAVLLSEVLWRMSAPLNIGAEAVLRVAALIAILFSGMNHLFGLNRVSWRHASPGVAIDIALSAGLSTGIATIAHNLWAGEPDLPPGMITLAGLFAMLGFLAVRYRDRLLTGLASRWLSRRTASLGERVLIVGAGECGLLANWLLKRSSLSSFFTVVGMLDDDPAKTGLTVDGHRVFGLTRRVTELVEQMDIGVILFAIEKIRPDEQQRILDLCRRTPARLVLVPDLLELFRQRMSLPEPPQAPA